MHISPNGELYGTERHILSIVKYSDRDKFEHHVATPVNGNFNLVLDKIGIKNEIAGRQPNKRNKASGFIESHGLRSLIRLIRREEFDIIHSHLNSYPGFFAKLLTNSKLVHTRHGVFWSETELNNIYFISKEFQKLKSRIFDITIAIGEYEKNTLINILNYNPEKIRLTFNGVNTSELLNKVDERINKQILFNTNDLIVGAVGRLEKQKGFHFLIDAAKDVTKKIKNVKFFILGEGSLRSVLEQQIRSLNLENYFFLLGYKENIYDYVNNFDVMVQTSLWEGISYVVLEAMALGKPVIALTTKHTSGVKEIIQDGTTGYLVDSDHPENIAMCILDIFCDINKLKKMGNESFRRVKNSFSEERTSKDMHDIYLELIK